MMTKCAFRTRFGKAGLKSRICLFSRFFTRKELPHLDDFLGSIMDHEGFHAREYFEEPGLIIAEPNPAVFELRAVENQLANAQRWNYSEALLTQVSLQKEHFMRQIREFRPRPWWQM